MTKICDWLDENDESNFEGSLAAPDEDDENDENDEKLARLGNLRLKANDMYVLYDRRILTCFCQLWSNMKMDNKPVIHKIA